jgi:hypothetical protein
MTALDNVSPAQFYHGTASDLSEGDTLTPGHAGGESKTGMDQVYVTTNVDQAKHYANLAAHGPGRGNDLVPRVYRVSPTPGSMTSDTTTGRNNEVTAARTYQPVKVEGKHWEGKSLNQTYGAPRPSVFDKWSK